MRLIAVSALIAAATLAAIPAPPASAQNALSVTIRPVDGSEAVAVRGTAPAGTAVTIALVAAYSRDLPDVVLRRVATTAATDGTFATTLIVAPAYQRGTVVTAIATTASGARASASLTIGAPRREALPLDETPHNVR